MALTRFKTKILLVHEDAVPVESFGGGRWHGAAFDDIFEATPRDLILEVQAAVHSTLCEIEFPWIHLE